MMMMLGCCMIHVNMQTSATLEVVCQLSREIDSKLVNADNNNHCIFVLILALHPALVILISFVLCSQQAWWSRKMVLA